MSSNLDAGQTDLDNANHGWKQTTTEEGHYVWWRNGSTHVNGSVEKLTAKKTSEMRGEWRLHKTTKNQYGLVESSKTLKKGTRGAILGLAHEHMEEYPSIGEFQSEPDIPDVVEGWMIEQESKENVDRRWEWYEFDCDERVIVEQVDTQERYEGYTRYYTTRYVGPEGEITVCDEEIAVRALRAAERLMKTYPDGGLGDGEVWKNLQSLSGIGPAKALELQVAGIGSVDELVEVVMSEDVPYEQSERVEKILTGRIRASVSDLVDE